MDVPKETEEAVRGAPEQGLPGFREIMDKVRRHTSDETVLILADVELIQAQHRLEGERFTEETEE